MPIKIAISLLLSSVLLPVNAHEFSIDGWKVRVEAESGINALGHLYLEFLLEEDPSKAVQFGVHGHEGDAWYYDRRMPDASPERAALNMISSDWHFNKLATCDRANSTAFFV